MDIELLKSMFLRARDHYESAIRWSFIIIVICIALHLLTFSQFVRFGKQLSHVQAEMDVFSGFKTNVDEVDAQLRQLEKTLTSDLDGRINTLLQELITDFEVLSQEVAQLRGEAVEATSPPPFFQGPVNETPATTFHLDERTVTQLQQAVSRQDLQNVVRPIIETQILQPRFDELNAAWKNDILPRITRQANTLNTYLQSHLPPLPEYTTTWEQIRTSVSQAVVVATDARFQLPTNRDWWASVAGKEVVLTDIQNTVLAQVKQTIAEETMTALQQQIEQALDQQKTLEQTLKTTLQRIADTFSKQQAQLTKLGKPFEFFSFDITSLVSKFPFLLGIILAGVTIWPAYRLWEMAWTADLLAKHGQEPLPLEWLWGHLCTALPKRCVPEVEETSPYHQAIIESIGRGMIFWIWIAWAAWELHGWGEVTANTILALMLGGWLAVAAAVGYRAYIIRRILSLKEIKRQETR